MNETITAYPRDACIPQLFEAQVEQTPDAVAVVFDNWQLSYGQLNQRANQLAHYLHACGVKDEAPVGVFLKGSAEMVAAMLGILKAGCCYVPLDLTYPKSRLAYMLEDTAAPLVLTRQDQLGHLPQGQAKVVCLDREQAIIAGQSPANLVVETSANQLAYIIYTSGSTGTAKGVGVDHRAVVRLVRDTNYIHVDAHDCVGQASNCSFDAATFEIWGALLNGARLVGIARDALLSPRQLAVELRQQSISVLFLTTALFNQVAREISSAFSPVKHVLFGGEAVDPKWVRKVLEDDPPQRLLHVYGPTENTTFSTWQRVQNVPRGATTVSIGCSIANTQTVVLDENLSPVPPDVPGQLFVGGDGLARGYWNDPRLTAQQFVCHPSSDEPGSRLYKTGDLVRYLPDGQIEFLGRIDDQVKIHGFRIEPREIETALSKHPEVRETVVLAREDELGQRRLVAYVVAAHSQRPAVDELSGFLEKILPEFMMPAVFMWLDALPLNANGKIDRSALPAPGAGRHLDAPYRAPQSDTQRRIAEIWQGVLNLEKVGIEDGFLDLGGHSLDATRMISQVRQRFQVDLPLCHVFENPRLCDLAEIIEQSQRGGHGEQDISIRPVSRNQDLPLSFSQERAWFIQHLHPGIRAYNTQLTLRLEGALDVPALKQSLTEIVCRHEIYRTTFPQVDGRPIQFIHPPQPAQLPIVSLDRLSTDEHEAEALRCIEQEFQTTFDVTQLPLVRWTLLRLSPQTHILVMVEHHLVHDGWSLNVFLGELQELYHAFTAGKPSPLPELPIQFADFAAWQRDWMRGPVADAQLAYWRRTLNGCPTALNLPLDRPRPAVQSFHGLSLRVDLPIHLCQSLRAVGQKEGATLFMTMFAAFATLMQRYCGQDDICIGTGVANRRWCETENLIGMIINNVVLRTDLSGDPTFVELVARVRRTATEAYAHQDLPFDHLVKGLGQERDASRNPLFQVMFSFHDSPLRTLELPGCSISLQEGLSNRTAKFDLNVVVIPRAEQRVGTGEEPAVQDVTMIWEYNTDLFHHSTIERIVGHYTTLLEAIVSNPNRHLFDFPLLDDAARNQLLVQWNQTSTDYPRHATIHELFEEQVERTPDSVAICYEGQQLTYRQLNARANQLASYLRKHGVGPEVMVGVSVRRSLEMVVGILGILKADGAYVPLDPEYPEQRLAFVLEDTQATVLLTQRELTANLPARGLKKVYLDSDWPSISLEGEQRPTSGATADNLAYVIYTSGSSGKPKGVAVCHRSVVRLVRNTDYVQIQPSDKVAQVANAAFDAATFEIWGSLLNGARLTGMAREVTLSPQRFATELFDLGITTLFVTTALFNQMAREMPRAFRRLRHVLFGGEAVNPVSVCQVLQHDPPERLLHVYGPTESTTFTTWDLVQRVPEDATTIPIGKPIANTRVHILDRYQNPVPIGVPGELFIGGDGVARGYLNRPELTAEKFVPDAFSDASGDRLYRSGDICRYLADGNVEFLGRRDGQTKIRGFRIELGEIESVLSQHPALAEAVVLEREDSAGDKRLVAYVATKQRTPPTIGEIRTILKFQLPDYMVPAAFVFLKELPLTANGKVDRRALPAPDVGQPCEEDCVLPRTETEQKIAAIWSELLHREQIGIHENFFELGGHSLLVTQVVSRLSDVFDLGLSLASVFEFSTVAELADYVDATLRAVQVDGASTGVAAGSRERGQI